MTTIEQCVAKGILEVVPVPDYDDRNPVRQLWATPSLLDEIEDSADLREMGEGGRSIYEHLWQFWADFRCARRPGGAGDLKRMMPTKKGVWKMHPPGLRVYGWVPRIHSFVCVTYATESDSHSDRGLNDRKFAEVLGFAISNDLVGTFKMGDYLALFPHQ